MNNKLISLEWCNCSVKMFEIHLNYLYFQFYGIPNKIGNCLTFTSCEIADEIIKLNTYNPCMNIEHIEQS